MDRLRHTAKTESTEDQASRQRWISRLQNIPMVCAADEGQLDRFDKALRQFQIEESVRVDSEKGLREARERLAGAQRHNRSGWQHAGALIPSHLEPRGEAWEGPEPETDEDVPPPPEV